MNDDSDEYLRGTDAGVSSAVRVLSDVLERGKQGNYPNLELERFATVLDKLRPALQKTADPAVRACVARTRAALASVETYCASVIEAMDREGDTPTGVMGLLGVVVANVEYALEKFHTGQSPVRTTDFTAGAIADMVAHGIALGAFELARDLVLSGIVSPERWNNLVESGYESGGGDAPFAPNLHGVVWHRHGPRPRAPLPLFEFYELNRELFRKKAQQLLTMLGSQTRPVP